MEVFSHLKLELPGEIFPFEPHNYVERLATNYLRRNVEVTIGTIGTCLSSITVAKTNSSSVTLATNNRHLTPAKVQRKMLKKMINDLTERNHCRSAPTVAMHRWQSKF